jgi:branched-chain amino acid transport system substrate-binding protein
LRRLASVALVVAVAAAAGCGGGTKRPIRIGVLAVCQGTYAPYYDEILAGAELPLLHRGGRLTGPKPEDGVVGAAVDGHRVEVSIGCSDDSGTGALIQARELVEHDHVDVLVGPETSAAGIALRDYARTKPAVAFSIGIAPATEPTLQRPAPNVFRYTTNAIQWTAGLGSYAYRTLGWRRVVVIGSDFQFPWAEVAGFTAEFCSLGGNVVDRIWGDAPRNVPGRGVDGYFISQYLPQYLVRAVRALPLRGPLARKLLLGASSELYAGSGVLGPRSVGVVGGSPLPIGSSFPAWLSFVRDYKRHFPRVALLGFAPSYDIAMEGALRGLESIHGDLAGDHRAFLTALAKVRFDGPGGPVRLNGHRQAIASNYLARITRTGGSFGVATIRTVPNVDDSYAGRFAPGKPLPSRTWPPCSHGNPPAWAR